MKKLFITFTIIWFSGIPCLSQDSLSQLILLSPVRSDSLDFIKDLPIWPKENPLLYTKDSKNSVKIGLFSFDKGKYQIAVVNTRSPNRYNIYSHLWLDENQNHKYDFYQELFEQMYIPFTFRNRSFKVTEVDSLGKYIKIMALDPLKIPPISIGLPAPNFSAASIDSVEFSLRDYRDKNVLLYFFSCNPFPLVPELMKVSEKYSNVDDFQIICIGTYLKNSSLPHINWIQVNDGSPY